MACCLRTCLAAATLLAAGTAVQLKPDGLPPLEGPRLEAPPPEVPPPEAAPARGASTGGASAGAVAFTRPPPLALPPPSLRPSPLNGTPEEVPWRRPLALETSKRVPQQRGGNLQGQWPICGDGKTPYQTMQIHRFHEICVVFCVPDGECHELVKAGKLYQKLGNIKYGGCKRTGFTVEEHPYEETLKSIKGLGACGDMTLHQFRPLLPDLPMVPEPTPPEAPSPSQPPAGRQPPASVAPSPSQPPARQQPPAIVEPSPSQPPASVAPSPSQPPVPEQPPASVEPPPSQPPARRQPPASVEPPPSQPPASVAPSPSQQPVREQPPQERVCASDSKAYEKRFPLHPQICGVFCVPQGQCEQKVWQDKFTWLGIGITQRGNCKSKGFTEPMEFTGENTEKFLEKIATFTGPCKGMSYTAFRKPAA